MQTSYVSTEPRLDGFGAQFQNIVFDILFTYTMTPHVHYVFPSNIDRMKFEHNYTNDPGFSDRLIRYMNLDTHFSKKDETAPIRRYNGIDNYAFCEANLTRLLETAVFKRVQRLFFEGKHTPYDAAFYNVAVHVRKYSADDMRIHRRKNESDSYYIGIMRFITAKYKGHKPIRFHIYSQGNATTEFAEYTKYSPTTVVMHLNQSVEDTFNGLVFADSLVTSASSFSYVAAMLTRGTVFYKKFWHKPSTRWFVGDDLITTTNTTKRNAMPAGTHHMMRMQLT